MLVYHHAKFGCSNTFKNEDETRKLLLTMFTGITKNSSQALIVVRMTLLLTLQEKKGLIEKLNPVKYRDGGYFNVSSSGKAVETKKKRGFFNNSLFNRHLCGAGTSLSVVPFHTK